VKQTIAKIIGVSLVSWMAFLVTGCAKHADFVELRDHLATMSKSQDQDQKRLNALQRRMESIERVRDGEPTKLKLDELSTRLQKLEVRMTKLEEGSVPITQPKSEPVLVDPTRSSKLPKPGSSPEAGAIIPNIPAITPTSAFNLSYNDYLNGKYDLAVAGFQRFVRDFPGTSLTPNAHYWLGESYYQQKDYVRAMQAFEYVATEFPGNEKVPAALYKLGLAAAETGDLVKSKKNLKRVLEEFPTSDEAKLAKNKLADLR
jgi:tol-pal system protein YbgF